VHTETRTGPVAGRLGRGGIAALDGTPYAALPVGADRWRPPQPPLPWSEPRHCRRVSAMAWQRAADFAAFFDGLISGLGLGHVRASTLRTLPRPAPKRASEHCPYRNVRAPVYPDGLPVMVWIHGGDHTDGSGGPSRSTRADT